MDVKVIKAINGLEEGDILHYNEKKHKYELMKQDEEIGDNGYKSTKTLHSYSKNSISNLTDYFIFIDEDGNKVDLKEDVKEEAKPISEIEQLKDRIKSLEQQLDQKYDVVYTTYPARFYNPFRQFFLY